MKIQDIVEFAPGNGGGESGRWYTDDQMTDLVGDGWWNDLDVSGDIPKQQMIQEAQAWLDDQGYSVHVLNCKVNDDDMEWFIEGSFQNSRFAKKGVAEGGFKNKTAVFSGYSNYMRSRAPNVFNQLGIKVLNKEYFEDEDIIEYTVISDVDSLAKARATLETNPKFGGMILKQGVAEAKQRLDAKCWDGYKKQGTKMKGDTRVNNCVPESVEQDVAEAKMSKQQENDFDRMRYGAMSRKEYDAKWKKPLKSDDEVIYGKKKVKEQGVAEGLDADQKKARQVPSTEMPKKTSPVLGKAPKQHPFKGRAVGGGL